jgi:replication factor A1
MRLNVGKYGAIKKADSQIESVNESLDMSEKEYQSDETDRRPRRSFNNNRNFRSRF